MGDNPVLLFGQKAADLFFGSVKGEAQGDFAVGGDADGAGLPFAVDGRVGQFIKFALVFDPVYVFHSCDYIVRRNFTLFYKTAIIML